MKRFRDTLPTFALTLCAGLLTFIAAELGVASKPDKSNPDNIPLELVFRPGQTDSSSPFTRQGSDGELDVADPESKSGSKTLALPSLVYQSLTLSSIVPVRQHQLPVIPIPSGSFTLLYRRLII